MAVNVGGALLPTLDMDVWPFKPSWSPSGSLPQNRYEYLTEVITSRSGKEQRIAQRQWPRLNMAFDNILIHDKMRHAKDLIWFGQGSPWVFHDFALHFRIQFDIAPDAMLEVPIGDRSNLPGWVTPGRILVMSTGDDWDWTIVESIVDISVVGQPADWRVNFARPVTLGRSVGDRVYCGTTGYLNTSSSMSMQTSAVGTMSQSIDVIPGSFVPVLETEDNIRYYDDLEVLTRKPNWANLPTSDFMREADVVDFTHGTTRTVYPIPFSTNVRQFTYLSRNPAAIRDLIGLFNRMYGRQGEFYTPSWESDFEVRQGVSASTTQLRVVSDRLSRYYFGSTVNVHAYLLMSNGELILFQIESMTEVFDSLGRDTILYPAAPFANPVSPLNVVSAGWLYRCRFANDALTIQYLTSEVANTVVNVHTLEALPSET